MNAPTSMINTLTGNKGPGKMAMTNAKTMGNNKGMANAKGTTNKKGMANTMGNKPSKKVMGNNKGMANAKSKKGKKTKKNVSLVGNMPNFKNPDNDIKISKKGLRKLLKSMFLDMGLEEQEIIKMLKQIGKDEQSVQNLTKLVNKTRKRDTERKAMIIKNMSMLKESVLKIYNQFDELNDNLGILFERKKAVKNAV